MTHFEWLRRQCTRDPRLATFIDQITEGVERGLAAERAGYSGGRSDDPKLRRKRYQTTASSILGKPRVRQLMELYELRKKQGEQSEVVSRKERRQVLSEIARSATPNEKRQAITALNAMDREDLDRREDGRYLKAGARTRIQQAVARHGEDKVVEALTVLGYANLQFWPDAFQDRLAKLERQYAEADDDERKQTGPTEGFPRGDARSPAIRRVSEVGGDAEGEMGERSPDASGAADRDRADRERDGARSSARDARRDAEVTPEDEAFMRRWQRGIGL